MNNLLMKDGSIETVADFDDALDIIRNSLGGEICDYISSCIKSVADDVNDLIYYYLKSMDKNLENEKYFNTAFYDKRLQEHINECKTKYKYNYS